MPVCSQCGTGSPGLAKPGQDNSTYVCENCQNLINLKYWKDEKDALEQKNKGGSATPSELRRLKFVQEKITAVEKE